MAEPAAWLKCFIHADPDTRELLVPALVEWGAGGVEEVGDQLAVYFPPDQRRKITTRLEAYAETTRSDIRWKWEFVPPVDWWQSWKAYFHPLKLSSRLWLCPTWEVTEPPAPQMRTLVMDPGRAFGTGGHETTRLCMEILDDEFAREKPGALLDVGCGSGILTAGARLLGVEAATALDIDPEAARATRENCARNDVLAGVEIFCGDLRAVQPAYPFVVANILYQVILGLAPELAARTAPGGRLVLSGFLVKEVEGAERMFHGLGFATIEARTMGEWGALSLCKDAP